MNKLTILGSGTSTGLPLIGCQCHVCLSNDPKDKRQRSSIFIESSKGKKILIDTTPDLRVQLLENKITDIDFAIITHDHADHLHGIDDLRPLCFMNGNKTIPVYADQNTLASMTNRFPYIFQSEKIFTKDKPVIGGGIPKLLLMEIQLNSPQQISGETFTFFHLPHGYTNTLGFIHEKMAYLIDCGTIPDDIVTLLIKENLDLLIIDAVKIKPHKTHLHFDSAMEYIKKINPKKAAFIHMGHDLTHQEISERYQSFNGITLFPSYDGQILTYESRN